MIIDDIIAERERKLVVKRFKKHLLYKQILDLEIEIESDMKDLNYFVNSKKEKEIVD